MQEGQAALGRADWARARECFEHALEQELPTLEELDGLGRALHIQPEYARAIELTERAFAAHLGTGRRVDTADRSRWLAFRHGAVRANMSVAGGWMARAEAALDGVEECAAHGWLELDRAPLTEEARRREQLAASALAVARRFANTDLEHDVAALVVALLRSAARRALESELDPQAASTVAQELLFSGLSQIATEALQGLRT